jgi:hypothetical protein
MMASNPKNPMELLRPKTYQPFAPESLAFMGKVEALLTGVKAKIVCVERT